ncbi:MAG: ABC transporter ATP-binding protein, partial [Firmicutes bacterium]|nr:ABC transporter ATP-binding protein [Bacillota bacterium]
PISAVDVSIQAQIINMLERLQDELNLSYMIIAHDLSMIKYISDRVAVMYLGKIVELLSSDNLYSNPLHPYTKALLSAVPIADPEVERSRKRIILEGDVPSPVNPPSGCYFHTRCSRALPICSEVEPEHTELGHGQWVACHNPG